MSLWLATVVAGLLCAVAYELRPAATDTPPATWPRSSKIDLASATTTVLMFVHPHCPCTRASLAELAGIREKCRNAAIRVVLVKPAGLKLEWRKSALWNSITDIPDARIVYDPAGKEADRFNARASGTTLAYDANGRLLFHGGITGARGHYGENPNSNALISAIRRQPGATSAAVFGCPLSNAKPSSDCCTQKN